MTTNKLPPWLANVPMKTVGVLCAVSIFGKNIESRQIVLAGKRYFHNAVENVVNYALNPILPDLSHFAGLYPEVRPAEDEALTALQNVTDCFNYIFHIQIEYFKLLKQLLPERFRFGASGRELHLNQFAAKSPTLLTSEKRYLILSRIDGAQPYDLDIDWNAEFACDDKELENTFRDRLFLAQDAYAGTLGLASWYNGRDRNLIIPLRVILDDLSVYFACLGRAAYHMAKNSRQPADHEREQVRLHLANAVRHLERFTLDLARVNISTIVKHDIDKLDAADIAEVVKARAVDESRFAEDPFDHQRKTYAAILASLAKAVDYAPADSRL